MVFVVVVVVVVVMMMMMMIIIIIIPTVTIFPAPLPGSSRSIQTSKKRLSEYGK